MWEAIATGFIDNLHVWPLVTIMIGTVVGSIMGALPGLSSVSAIALMLPFTFTMDPAQGLVMLAAVYMSAEFGGSIPAILINTPGIPAAAVTTLDGYPMTQQGRATEALYLQLLAGVVGGALGAVVLVFFTPYLARVSLLIGPAEYFWLAVAGLALVAGLSGRNILKGLLGAALGIFCTIPGQDGITGTYRFTYGYYQLSQGVEMVPALLGLFAVASILALNERRGERLAPLNVRKGALRSVLVSMNHMKRLLARSSIIGVLIGMLPGAGASIASFLAYGEAKRISKHPERFGNGAEEGVLAPEAANNAVVGGSMIPLLTFGIPGSASAAVLFAALTVHGIFPGPRLFAERADIAYSFMTGLALTVVAMLIFGLATIRYQSLIVRAPVEYMLPGVLSLAIVGTFGLRLSMYDVGLLLIFGVGGFLLARMGVPPITVALGLVLGKLIEQNYQRSLTLSGAANESLWAFFFGRPIAIGFMLVAVAIFVSGIVQSFRTPPGGDLADDTGVDGDGADATASAESVDDEGGRA